MSTVAINTRSNIVWYALPRLLSVGMNVLLLPIYARVLAPAEFGTAMVAVAVASLSSLLVAPGIEGVYMRWAHQRSGLQGIEGTGLGTLTMLHLAMLTLGTGALVVGARTISAVLMPGIPPWPFYYIVVVTLFVTSLQAPLRADWRITHRADKVARFEFAKIAITTGTILAALLLARLGPVSILLGELVAGLVLLPMCARPIVAALPEGWDHRVFKAIAPIALVGLPLSLSGYALSTLDRIALNRYADVAAVGIYAAAYQIGALLMAVTITLNKEWQPLIFHLAAGPVDEAETLQRLWTRSLCLVFFAGGVVSCLSAEIVRWWLGPAYEASARVVPWVVLMALLRTARFFLTNLSLALGRAADLTVEGLLSVVIFAGGNVLLVPSFGVLGAAWAGVITYAIGTVFLFSRSWNTYRIDRRLALSMSAAGGAVLLGSMMGGTVLTRGVGVVLAGLIIADAAAYWRFLGTLNLVKAES